MSTNKVSEKVIAVGVVLPDRSRRVAEEHLDELEKLTETAGGTVITKILAKRDAPDAATWIGSGKAEEIKRLAEKENVSLIVFDDELAPAQTRNLAKIIATKVLDRSALILDIFARRAKSREARTQVELAQLEYMLPRLTRQWSHLERQAGGIGTRGVGETQLEIDRRIVRNKISQLKGELQKMEEAVSADLVLHVIDSTHEEQAVVGREVLAELGIPDERVIEVFNKEDLSRAFGGTAISALTGRGIEKLVDMIRERELAGGEVL